MAYLSNYLSTTGSPRKYLQICYKNSIKNEIQALFISSTLLEKMHFVVIVSYSVEGKVTYMKGY